MTTYNNKFLVKNGLAVNGVDGPIDVISNTGSWIGATGNLAGASGATGITGATGTNIYLAGIVDFGTFDEPSSVSLDFGSY